MDIHAYAAVQTRLAYGENAVTDGDYIRAASIVDSAANLARNAGDEKLASRLARRANDIRGSVVYREQVSRDGKVA